MKRAHVKPTNADNLEAKFDRGEEVLDYFNDRAAKVVQPRKRPIASVSVKNKAGRTAVIHERFGSYRTHSAHPKTRRLHQAQ